MSKPIRLLVTTIDGETDIYTEAGLADLKMSDEDIKQAFGNNAYWMKFTLKECTFADQQAVTREAVNDRGVADDTLVPQKRFVKAVEQGSWTKQFADQKEEGLLAVTEQAFIELRPPALGNVIDNIILQSWYPGASKSRDFMRAWREKQAKSAEEKKSESSQSTPESSPTTAGEQTGHPSTHA